MTVSRGLYDGIVIALFSTIAVAFLFVAASVVITYGLPSNANDAMAVFYVGIFAAMISVPFAAIAAFFIGMPLLLYWRGRGFTSRLHYFAAGVIMTLLVVLAIGTAHRFAGFLVDSDFALALWIIAVAGPVAALTVKLVSPAII